MRPIVLYRTDIGIVKGYENAGESEGGEDDGGLSLNIADAGTIVDDVEAGEAFVAPSLAPTVLDKPVVELEIMIVAVANNRDCRVYRCLKR